MIPDARQIYGGDSYETPAPLAAPVGDRLFGSFWWWYFPRMMERIAWCARDVKKNGGITNEAFSKYSIVLTRLTEYCGARMKITGMENINKVKGPCLYIGNHMSLLETIMLPAIILTHQRDRKLNFVIKNTLVDYPVFGVVMRSIEPIVVGRQNPREDLRTVLEQGRRLLERGDSSLVVFPQSTRSPHFDPEAFNSIGVKLARAAKVPVVPIALKTDFLGNGRIFKNLGGIDRRKKVRFEFGAPITVSGNGRDEHRMIVEFISQRVDEWQKREEEK